MELFQHGPCLTKGLDLSKEMKTKTYNCTLIYFIGCPVAKKLEKFLIQEKIEFDES